MRRRHADITLRLSRRCPKPSRASRSSAPSPRGRRAGDERRASRLRGPRSDVLAVIDGRSARRSMRRWRRARRSLAGESRGRLARRRHAPAFAPCASALSVTVRTTPQRAWDRANEGSVRQRARASAVARRRSSNGSPSRASSSSRGAAIRASARRARCERWRWRERRGRERARRDGAPREAVRQWRSLLSASREHRERVTPSRAEWPAAYLRAPTVTFAPPNADELPTSNCAPRDSCQIHSPTPLSRPRASTRTRPERYGGNTRAADRGARSTRRRARRCRTAAAPIAGWARGFARPGRRAGTAGSSSRALPGDSAARPTDGSLEVPAARRAPLSARGRASTPNARTYEARARRVAVVVGRAQRCARGGGEEGAATRAE